MWTLVVLFLFSGTTPDLMTIPGYSTEAYCLEEMNNVYREQLRDLIQYRVVAAKCVHVR